MEKIDDQKLLSSGLEKLMPVKTVLLLKSLGQTAFPQKSQQIQRQILFLISVWIIVSDQFFESKKVPLTTLRRFSSYATKQMRDGFRKKNYKIPTKAYWSYCLIKNICEIMGKAEINAQMFSLFKKSIGQFFRAMIKEKTFSFKNIPSFNAYIENGRKSIGSDVALYAIGALIFTKPYLSARESVIIKKITYHSSIILRLSNDIGSYERENRAEKINSLSILMKKQNLLFSKARLKLIKLIKKNGDLISLYRKTSNKQLKQYIKTVSRLLDFNIKLYAKRDYYDE